MKVMRPIDITAPLILATTIAAEDPSAVWAAGQAANSYVLGDLRHRAETHRVYERVKVEAAATAEHTLPENDPYHWKNIRPTNKWAAFDPWRLSDKSTVNNTLRWVLRPMQFVDAVWLGGISGAARFSIVARYMGVEYFRQEGSMEGAMRTNWYRYWTEPFVLATDALAIGMPIRPDPEIEIELTGPGAVSLGFICLSKLAILGETRFGAKTNIVDFNTVKQLIDGGVNVTMRGSAREMEATARIDVPNARYADSVLESVRGRPALVIGADRPVYEALRVFGLGSGTQSYDNPKFNTLNLKVKGV